EMDNTASIVDSEISYDNDSTENQTGEVSSDALQSRIQYRQHYYDRFEILKKQLDNDADNVELLLETSNAAQMLAKRDEAIDMCRKAVKIMKNNDRYSAEEVITVQKKIIAMLVRTQNVNMAIVEFKELTLLFPENAKIRADFAQFLITHGFPRRAFLEYKKILSVIPDDVSVLEQILFLKDQGYISAEEAEPLLNK
ncbi:hypothetical protein KDK77_07730, partial [bacterium]|nr:hypothetical protein [bacterium]